MRRQFATLTYGALLGLAVSATAAPLRAWANAWDDEAINCLVALAKPAPALEKQLAACADAFGTSARLERLSAHDRQQVEAGLKWLYEHGSDDHAQLARESLLRLEVRLPRRPARPAASPQAADAPNAARYDPPEARTADREAAEKLLKDGVALNRKKKWQDGAATLTKALEKDPRSEGALYNLACSQANLADGRLRAPEHLRHLADLGTETATARLIKARTDPDFDPIRDDPAFKQVTGAVRVQVVNTIGAHGESAVENIAAVLVKLDQRKPDTRDEDGAPRDHPQVQFRPHAAAQTALLADLLNHPRVELQPMPAENTSNYDIIVRWGARIATDADGKKQVESEGPEVVDEQVAAARRKQNKVLAQPEWAINKVQKVVETPGRTYTEAVSMGKRAAATAEKAKAAAEKVKEINDKASKL